MGPYFSADLPETVPGAHAGQEVTGSQIPTQGPFRASWHGEGSYPQTASPGRGAPPQPFKVPCAGRFGAPLIPQETWGARRVPDHSLGLNRATWECLRGPNSTQLRGLLTAEATSAAKPTLTSVELGQRPGEKSFKRKMPQPTTSSFVGTGQPVALLPKGRACGRWWPQKSWGRISPAPNCGQTPKTDLKLGLGQPCPPHLL